MFIARPGAGPATQLLSADPGLQPGHRRPRSTLAYKHSRIKQYLKEGRALRIETVINKPCDIGVLRRLEHLPELVAKARQVNDRLLMIERAGQGCAIGSALFERIHQPYIQGGPSALDIEYARSDYVSSLPSDGRSHVRVKIERDAHCRVTKPVGDDLRMHA